MTIGRLCGFVLASARRRCVVDIGGRRMGSKVAGNSTVTSSSRPRSGRMLRASFGTMIIGGTLGGTAYMYRQHSLHADHDEDACQTVQRNQTPLSTLLRSYVVYSLCSVPALVDWSPTILSTLFSVPGVRQVTEAIVRVTFFSQFVGGDTAVAALPLLEQLRKENKGALFAYSVEVDEKQASGKANRGGVDIDRASLEELPMHKRIIEEMIQCIDVAANFEDQRRNASGEGTLGRKTWVALKLTAMLPNAQALVNLSRHLSANRPFSESMPFPGCPHKSDLDILDRRTSVGGRLGEEVMVSNSVFLSAKDIRELRELKEDLFRVCRHAKERGVRVIVDAEYSWYQPAIDAYTFDLMRIFNARPQYRSYATAHMSPRNIPRSYAISDRALPNNPTDENEPVGVQPLVYATFQAYLRRTPAYLAQSLRDAEEGNYVLGVKLVRGAYHPHELAAHHALPIRLLPHASLASPNQSETTPIELLKRTEAKSPSISPDVLPPVWLIKAETDACYDEAARILIAHVHKDFASKNQIIDSHDLKRPVHLELVTPPHVGLLFGTHNWSSCDVILDTLVRYGLASKESTGSSDGRDGVGVREVVRIAEDVAEYVTIGQLYGMSDSLTNSLVERTRCNVPFVIKYVPYGALTEVMPYLSRRAIENKSILGDGGALDERRRAGEAIYRHIFG